MKKRIKYIIISALFLITVQSSYIYPECHELPDKYGNNPKGLATWIENSQKDKISICYYYIGTCYFQYYFNEYVHENNAIKRDEYLSKAKNYLEAAAVVLGSFDDNSETCNRMLIELEYQSTPDLNKISEYIQRSPTLDSFADELAVKHTNINRYKEIINNQVRSHSPNFQVIYQALQEPGVRINDENKEILIRTIENQLNPYLTIFTEKNDPDESMIRLYRQFSTNASEKLKDFRRVHGFKKKYLTLERKLETSASKDQLNDVNSIVHLLKSHYTMEKIQPYIKAYHSWRSALRSMNNLPKTANARCTQCEQLIQEYERIRHTLKFAQPPDKLDCCRALSCLEEMHNLDDIIPDYNDQQRQEKYQRCMSWLNEYKIKINRCGTDHLVEDKRPFLNELIQLFQAINAYHERTSSSALDNIHTVTPHGRIKNISGQYLANHYYKVVFNELKRGKMINTN